MAAAGRLVAVGINVPGAVDVGHRTLGDIALLLTVPLIPAAIAVAILRHRLFDIRLVVSRAVLYLVLTGGVVGGYAALVAVLDRALRGAGAPILATLVIALAFNPLRVRLQRLVERAFHGARADPVRAVSQVGERLAGDDLDGVVAGIRDALRVPFVALRGTSRGDRRERSGPGHRANGAADLPRRARPASSSSVPAAASG